MTDTAAPRYKTPPDRELVPRVMVRAMLALVLSVLAIVSLAVYSGRPVTSTPPQAEVILERTVFLEGEMSARPPCSTPTASSSPGCPRRGRLPRRGGPRARPRAHQARGAAHRAPVILTGHANGRIAIHDPSTGWRADLMGFGQDNARDFVRLLAPPTRRLKPERITAMGLLTREVEHAPCTVEVSHRSRACTRMCASTTARSSIPATRSRSTAPRSWRPSARSFARIVTPRSSAPAGSSSSGRGSPAISR